MLAQFETFLRRGLATITVKPLQIFIERRSAAFFRRRTFQVHDLMLPRSPMMFETALFEDDAYQKWYSRAPSHSRRFC